MCSIEDFGVTYQNGGDEENNHVEELKHSLNVNQTFRSLQISDLATELTSTGMKDEVLLLSWLIVLLRTRRDELNSYEWAYESHPKDPQHRKNHVCQYKDHFKQDLQGSVEEATASIARQLRGVLNQKRSISSLSSIVLSTGSLSQMTDKVNDEGVLHIKLAYKNGSLEIEPVWQTENMLLYNVTRHIETLLETIQICLSYPEVTVEKCIRPTTYDMKSIWGWNHQLPKSYKFCMHEVIFQKAQQFPNKVGIESWDGSLTYDQIDRYSTFIASRIHAMGVILNDFLPVCFEKSRWTIVAVLAVMKAGATFVMMDPSLPLARLQNMAKQVGAKIMLTSRKQYCLSKSVLPDKPALIIEAETFDEISNLEAIPRLKTVPSSTLMYIIFTSGSTGNPKGVKISHETYTSSAFPRAKAVGYTEDSRVLDFASYAFDVSIDSMLLTLANGGCLCIPSDEDRMNDINGVIRNMRVNYAGITPSVARVLEPEVIKSLSGLGLGGEAASVRDVNIWGRDTRIIIGYGPCECTIGCTVNSDAASGRDYISIGTGNGGAIWVVDPNDHEVLMPVGAVGELLVEGPIVGQGYLNDLEKTAAVFVENPAWLIEGYGKYAGRCGRLYKTGDLGKYDPDGSGGIIFVGRKDTQVKLRGQRVELGEIESQLKSTLPSEANIIAEVIVPKGSGGQATLVAFITSQTNRALEGHADLELQQTPDDFNKKLSSANAELAKVLPRYMVPTVYISVNYIPVLISGKTDRRKLRNFGATVDLRLLDQSTEDTAHRELSDLERRLRHAWGQVLELGAESIRPDDNFFVLGGDSLAAMKLVSICREERIDVTVANTFDNPTLSAMAGAARIRDTESEIKVPRFSMISKLAETICSEASQIYGFEQGAIEDMYPCTPTQESLFTFSLKSVKPYVAQRLLRIPSHMNIHLLKKAWELVVNENPILRTRVAQLQEPGLQQIVLKENIDWKYSRNLAEYLEHDRNHKMNLGQSLARYAIVNDSSSSKHYMVWTVHHVLYDGWSEPIILKQVNDLLQNLKINMKSQMKNFVKYLKEVDEIAMQEYWRKELKNAVGPQFPRLPSRDYLPNADVFLEHEISIETVSGLPVTMATLIRGAWALVASQYTGSDDVIFGETLTGRDIALAGVESIIGPLIATVPVRIHLHRACSVQSYLQTIQRGTLARVPYQHMGMQNIRKVSQDAQYACEAGTGLVIQPEPEYTGTEIGFAPGDVIREALHFNPYPLMLACGIRKGGFRICANFDSNLVDVQQMRRMLAQLEVACSQLIQGSSRRIGEISCLPRAELDQIWRWNKNPPCSFDKKSRRPMAAVSTKGSAYPQVANPWVCDPRNPFLLSPIGCIGELWFEGGFLSDDAIESPNWLTSGSSTCGGRVGKVQATGDMVKLLEDGNIIFMGRKGDVVPVQGHAVNIPELEAHIVRHLPSTSRAAASVFLPQIHSTASTVEEELAVFVEQSPFEEDGVELTWMPHRIVYESSHAKIFEMTTLATIPKRLSMALRSLNKFLQDSFPSYMVPSTYIVVDKLPTVNAQIDHNMLNKLATNIPTHVFNQIREGFKKLWTEKSTQAKLTHSERILQSSWADILKISPEKINVDDNFFRLGGDSVLAMKLVSNLRAQGHSLTVADIFQHMRLGDAAQVLKLGHASRKLGTKVFRPFSTLGLLNIDSFLFDVVQPKLADSRWLIRDVAPVTDSQALDIKATIYPPRTSLQYTMLYFNRDTDRAKLFHAFSELVNRHDILRTVFIEHGSQFFQVVVERMDIQFIEYQVEGVIEEYVNDLCTKHIESDFQLGSSFVNVMYIKNEEGHQCLVLGLSHAQYDGHTLPRLLRDLESLYVGETAIDPENFTSYVAYIRNKDQKEKAIDYWRNLLHGSSLSVLTGKSGQSRKAVFKSKVIDGFSTIQEITTASLLTAAWALVLSRRLQTADVTFGTVTSGRNVDVENIDDVAGPCYQFTPIRVSFIPHWTGIDLLKFVQKQSAQSAAYDFLGFSEISKHCAVWSSAEDGRQFFDSIVHHQDFEDFDTMKFAGGTCKVDILSPHGDAADPLKVVSFIRGGHLHVGVVGSAEDTEFVDSVLTQLAETIQEILTDQSKVISFHKNNAFMNG